PSPARPQARWRKVSSRAADFCGSRLTIGLQPNARERQQAFGNARPSLTNATLAASRLLHRRSPTAPCSKGALAAHRKKLAAFSALGGDCGPPRGPRSVLLLRTRPLIRTHR